MTDTVGYGNGNNKETDRTKDLQDGTMEQKIEKSNNTVQNNNNKETSQTVEGEKSDWKTGHQQTEINMEPYGYKDDDDDMRETSKPSINDMMEVGETAEVTHAKISKNNGNLDTTKLTTAAIEFCDSSITDMSEDDSLAPDKEDMDKDPVSIMTQRNVNKDNKECGSQSIQKQFMKRTTTITPVQIKKEVLSSILVSELKGYEKKNKDNADKIDTTGTKTIRDDPEITIKDKEPNTQPTENRNKSNLIVKRKVCDETTKYQHKRHNHNNISLKADWIKISTV